MDRPELDTSSLSDPPPRDTGKAKATDEDRARWAREQAEEEARQQEAQRLAEQEERKERDRILAKQLQDREDARAREAALEADRAREEEERKGRASRSAPLASESGDAERARNLPDWIGRAAVLDQTRLMRTLRSPEKMAELIQAAKRNAEQRARERRPDISDDSRLMTPLRFSTAHTDSKHAENFRTALRQLELIEGSNKPALDAIRDVFITLKKQVENLGKQDGLADNANLRYIKDRVGADIDKLISTTGRIAFDETGLKRAGVVCATAATLATSALPFAFAYYSEPTAFFYLGGLAGAYARTTALAAGIVRNPGSSLGDVWDHFKERDIIWELPSAIYGIPTFMQAHATYNPDNKDLREQAEKAIKITEQKWFLSLVGVAEAAIFMGANHTEKAFKVICSPIRAYDWLLDHGPTQATQFASGAMQIARPNTPDQGAPALTVEQVTLKNEIDAMRGMHSLGSRLFDAVITTSAKHYEGKREPGNHEPLAASETAIITKAKVLLGELAESLEQTVGGIKAAAIPISDHEKSQKKAVGSALLIAGGVLGGISSLAAIKVPALLTDYIPYYLATELLLFSQMRKNTLTPDNLARTFGSYFGGTVLGIAPSLLNLGSEFSNAHEGFWDLVTHRAGDLVTQQAAEFSAHPSLQVTKVPGLHGFATDGKVNLSIFMAYSVLSTLWLGGKAGEFIADQAIKHMKHAAELPALDHDVNFTPQEVAAIDTLFTAMKKEVQQQRDNTLDTELGESSTAIKMKRIEAPKPNPLEDVQKRHANWPQEAAKLGDAMHLSEDELNAFAKQVGFAAGIKAVEATQLGENPRVTGFALSQTQIALVPETQQGQLRVLTLKENEQVHPEHVNDREAKQNEALKPGEFFVGKVTGPNIVHAKVVSRGMVH